MRCDLLLAEFHAVAPFLASSTSLCVHCVNRESIFEYIKGIILNKCTSYELCRIVRINFVIELSRIVGRYL